MTENQWESLRFDVSRGLAVQHHVHAGRLPTNQILPDLLASRSAPSIFSPVEVGQTDWPKAKLARHLTSEQIAAIKQPKTPLRVPQPLQCAIAHSAQRLWIMQVFAGPLAEHPHLHVALVKQEIALDCVEGAFTKAAHRAVTLVKEGHVFMRPTSMGN